MQKKRTSPVFWIAFIGLVIAVFVFLSPEDAAKKGTVKNTPPKKKTADSLFTEEDYKAKFEPLNSNPKNAFMPVVMRKVGTPGESAAPNALPLSITGGEAGWMYTGTAEVDGKIQAVIENPGTGQGDFLSVGQNWKKGRVVSVTDSLLVFASEDGQHVTVKMQEKLSTGSMVAGGFSPVRVNSGGAGGGRLRGNIGPLTIQPDGVQQPAGTQTIEGEGNAN